MLCLHKDWLIDPEWHHPPSSGYQTVLHTREALTSPGYHLLLQARSRTCSFLPCWAHQSFPNDMQVFSSGCQQPLPKVPTSRMRLNRLPWGRKGDDEHWTKLGATVHVLVFTQTCSTSTDLALSSVDGFCTGNVAGLQFMLDIRPRALPLQSSLSRLMNASFRKSISAASYKGH